MKIVDAQVREMDTQMAALDQFVIRARSQNDDHHTERVKSLSSLTSKAQDGFDQADKDTSERKAGFDDFENEQKTHLNELDDLASTLQDDARVPLQELSAENADTGFTDYLPTGETPQKREWMYPTQLSRTANHESITAKRRGLPDPTLAMKTPSSARTPGMSPRKQASPRKAPTSPSKLPSPSKTKVFTDFEPKQSRSANLDHGHTISIPLEQSTKSGLKEIDINTVQRPASSSLSGDDRPAVLIDFSKSMGSASGGQPPLKRHATTNAVVESRLPMKLSRAKSHAAAGAGTGVENFSQSVGPAMTSGRRLRSSHAD